MLVQVPWVFHDVRCTDMHRPQQWSTGNPNRKHPGNKPTFTAISWNIAGSPSLLTRYDTSHHGNRWSWYSTCRQTNSACAYAACRLTSVPLCAVPSAATHRRRAARAVRGAGRVGRAVALRSRQHGGRIHPSRTIPGVGLRVPAEPRCISTQSWPTPQFE